jgi:hypothetical protein
MSSTSSSGSRPADRSGEERFHRVEAPPQARLRELEAHHAAEIERLQTRLREVEAERDEARRAAQWLSQADAAPRPRIALEPRLPRLSPTRARLAGPLAFVAVLAIAAVAIATAGGPDKRPSAPRVVQDRPAAPVAANLPPCSRAIRAGARRVTCRTGSGKALTVAGFGQPVLLGDIQVRALGTTRVGDGLTIRLRIRNESETRQILERAPRNLYLSVAGRRFTGVDVDGPRVLEPARTQTVNLAFQLDAASGAALNRRGGADLGVRDFAGGDARQGVSRIAVQRFTEAG